MVKQHARPSLHYRYEHYDPRLSAAWQKKGWWSPGVQPQPGRRAFARGAWDLSRCTASECAVPIGVH